MELIIMGRRLDYNKASRNDQARYGLSVKDEAEWMQNDAAARWLRKHSRVVSINDTGYMVWNGANESAVTGAYGARGFVNPSNIS
jgi:hypothetical protein